MSTPILTTSQALGNPMVAYASPADALTFATCLGPNTHAAKTFSTLGANAYRCGRDFHYVTVPVDGLTSLNALLHEVTTHRRTFLVLGRANVERGRRLAARRWGDQRTLVAKPCHVLPLDLDSIAAPQHVDPRDVFSAGRYTRSLLSPELARAACVAQLTSGAGLKPGLRVRLFYWLTRPIDLIHMKRWIETQPVRCDLAIYQPHQPIYTAAPHFDGVTDPCAGRPRIAFLEAP